MTQFMNARAPRRNAHGRMVYDIYRVRDGSHFQATVEIDASAAGGMRVLIGALQPAGKIAAHAAIAAITESLP